MLNISNLNVPRETNSYRTRLMRPPTLYKGWVDLQHPNPILLNLTVGDEVALNVKIYGIVPLYIRSASNSCLRMMIAT